MSFILLLSKIKVLNNNNNDTKDPYSFEEVYWDIVIRNYDKEKDYYVYLQEEGENYKKLTKINKSIVKNNDVYESNQILKEKTIPQFLIKNRKP